MAGLNEITKKRRYKSEPIYILFDKRQYTAKKSREWMQKKKFDVKRVSHNNTFYKYELRRDSGYAFHRFINIGRGKKILLGFKSKSKERVKAV